MWQPEGWYFRVFCGLHHQGALTVTAKFKYVCQLRLSVFLINIGLNSVAVLHCWDLELKSCLKLVCFFHHFLLPCLVPFQQLQLLVLGNFCI
jgi:hypothetical protein